MKTIQFIFFIAIGSLLMAADCSNKDSEFYNDVFIKVPNLIEIEKKTSYNVNDILWINSDAFSRYLNQTNKTNLLDVYKTTGGALGFNFSFVLEKQVSLDEWSFVSLDSNLINQKGISYETDEFVNAKSIYNDINKKYDFRTGLKITQPGTYRLSFGYNSTVTDVVELRSDSQNNNLFINIDSVVEGLNGDGFYIFTVN